MDAEPDNDPRLPAVAAALVAASACDLRSQTGETIEIWTIEADGPTITASAPRLAVRAGMSFLWRTRFGDTPVVATVLVEDAVYHSERRARLQLRVTDVRDDGARRGHPRRSIALPAALTAVSCDRIVDGDTLPATILDISDTGIRLRTSDPRPRPRDRFRLNLHSLGARLETDIRVMRAGAYAANVDLGCAFIDLSPYAANQISHILSRLENQVA
jgi:PilZ domain